MVDKGIGKLIFPVIFIFSFLIFSCSEDDESNHERILSANIDGQPFEPHPHSGLSYAKKDDFFVYGEDLVGKHLLVRIYNYSGDGTYTLDSTDENGYAVISYYSTSLEEMWTSELNSGEPEGEVTITSYGNNRVKGTFHGKISNADGTEIKSVTEGIFDLTISVPVYP